MGQLFYKVTRGLTSLLYYAFTLYSLLVIFGLFYDSNMRIITEGLVPRLFAATESDHHFIFCYKFDWFEFCSLV
jgi:hypothetical protein